jgi:hypothetical protein
MNSTLHKDEAGATPGARLSAILRLPLAVLTGPDEFWTFVRSGQGRTRDLLALVGFIVAACAVYGAILAGWRSPLLALYVAVKLPLLFLVTTGVVSLFNWMAASAMGCPLGYRQTLFLAAGAMTTAGWILLSLAPVSLFFIHSAMSQQGRPEQLRYAHNVMLMTHIAVMGAAGLAGNTTLLRGLRALAPSRERAGGVFVAWLTVSAFVGCQTSWILRPFVGSPFYPVDFLRPDALQRNFYEFVFGEVLPFIITGGTRP